MSTSTPRRVANGLWLAIGVLWVGALSLVLAGSSSRGSDLTIMIVLAIPMAVYGSVGALVARSGPRNPIGWILLAVGFAIAMFLFGAAYAQVGLQGADTIGDLPGATLSAWIAMLAQVAALPIALPLFLLFFPDGHLRSGRWRPVLWITILAGCSMGIGALGIGWNPSPIHLDPIFGSGHGVLAGIFIVGTFVVIATSFAGLLALILRFREASPEHRQALRLLVGVLVAMAAALTALFLANVLTGAENAEWGWLVFLFGISVLAAGLLVGIPLAAAAAVLTFGIYDVGVVVKKTVVYVALVVVSLLLLGFLALILNPLLLMGGGESNGHEDTVARIATAASVIVVVLVLAFRPVKRLARRLVYGKRSTPYEAMSQFSERLGEAYSTQDVLPRMASILQASTGAASARVWLHVGGELRPVASAPQEIEDVAPLRVIGDEPAAPVGSRIFLVRDPGELLGALTVTMPPAEPLSKTGEQLVLDLASQAGLVLRNVRLVEELQESRRRIVTAQDERARKLERDIHDGAQQQLVALSVKMRLVDQLVDRDPAKAHALVEQVQADTTDALETLRELARGIYPPLLADKGLVAALEAQARKVAVPARVHGDGIGRFDRDVEAGVYFCVLEALNNVSKYAAATQVDIRLSNGTGGLAFEVGDDGVGFDTSAGRTGTGLQGMADRLSALGGTLEVRSAPGSGTVVAGSIPIGTSS